VTPFLADVAPRTGKIIKNGRSLLKEKKICYKMYTTLGIYVKPIVRKKLRIYTDEKLFWKGLGT